MKELLSILEKNDAVMFLTKDKAVFHGTGIFGELEVQLPIPEGRILKSTSFGYKVLQIEDSKIDLRNDKLIFKKGKFEAFVPCEEDQLPKTIDVESKIYFSKTLLEKLSNINSLMKKLGGIEYINIESKERKVGLGNDSIYIEIKGKMDIDKEIKNLTINTDNFIIPNSNYLSLGKHKDMWCGCISKKDSNSFIYYIMGEEIDGNFIRNIKKLNSALVVITIDACDARLFSNMCSPTLILDKGAIVSEQPESKLLCDTGELKCKYMIPSSIFKFPTTDELKFIIYENQILYTKIDGMEIYLPISEI